MFLRLNTDTLPEVNNRLAIERSGNHMHKTVKNLFRFSLLQLFLICCTSLISCNNDKDFSSKGPNGAENDIDIKKDNKPQNQPNKGNSEDLKVDKFVADGIRGGHFDVDTFEPSGAYVHVHEYDDEYNTTGVYFIGQSNGSGNADDVKFKLRPDLSPFQSIKISIRNYRLNQNARLQLNNSIYTVDTFPSDGIDMRYADIKSLRLYFNQDVLSRSLGIHPSSPSDVQNDPVKRNGAVVLVLSNAITGEVYAEGALYWHKPSL